MLLDSTLDPHSGVDFLKSFPALESGLFRLDSFADCTPDSPSGCRRTARTKKDFGDQVNRMTASLLSPQRKLRPRRSCPHDWSRAGRFEDRAQQNHQL